MSRCRKSHGFVQVALASLVVFCAKPLMAQIGTTTDVIVGRVVGPDSMGLRIAHVDVTSIESGITRKQVTGDDGRYSVIFPDGGGRYLLTVHYLGMAPVRMLLQRRGDEDRLVANFTLTPTAVRLSAVAVEAQRIADSLGVGAGAIGQVLSKELLEQLGYEGNEAAALALVTPGVTLMQGGDTSMNAIAINGQSASQTGHLIDGLAAGSGSLPAQAVKSTSVITSAYDVANGQFTGGFVQQSTISGTNKFNGSLDSSVPLAPMGTVGASQGVLTRTQKGYRGGGSLAGPFIKDHLFGAMAYSLSSSSTPSASIYSLEPTSLDRLGVIPDSVARFMRILDSHGLAKPVGNPAGVQQSGFRTGFGRLDFTPNEKNTLTLSASGFRFWNQGFLTGPLATPTAGGQYSTESWRAQIALTSHLGALVN
ncbi:MAG: TonB-dependent receptor, partial [Gemmatimonadota bacterium]|nr:TonB-dependent receptor [Gemmatimonadota bacterium]